MLKQQDKNLTTNDGQLSEDIRQYLEAILFIADELAAKEQNNAFRNDIGK